jgi:multiple sugar transport system substrate-binding protein
MIKLMAEPFTRQQSPNQPPWLVNSSVSETALPETPSNLPSESENAESGGSADDTLVPEATVQPSPFRKIIPIFAILMIVGLLVFVIKSILAKKGGGLQFWLNKKNKEVTLTYWGLWEPKTVLEPLLADYKKEHPEVTLDYVFQSPKDYRERLQSALAAGKGPDIFRIHLTWLPMFLNQGQLAAVPENLFDWSDYYSITEVLKNKGQYYAVPLGIDTLALFYNSDIFKAAGVEVPTTWEELRNAANKLSVRDKDGRLQLGGIALGTTNNVDNWSDIVGLMMLQNGADLAQPTDKLAEDALKFYSLFSRVYQVWDETMPPSTYAFANGKVAMLIAPSWRAFEIKDLNPNLNFKITEVPQLMKDDKNKITWATFWVEAVAKDSVNAEAAWQFLKFLSQPENLKKLYTNESQIRLFGEPYPLKSLAKELETHPLVAPFVKQAPFAKTWFLCSRTHDNGINDRMIKYYEDALGMMAGGGSPQAALSQAAAGVKQVLNQYGISSP